MGSRWSNHQANGIQHGSSQDGPSCNNRRAGRRRKRRASEILRVSSGRVCVYGQEKSRRWGVHVRQRDAGIERGRNGTWTGREYATLLTKPTGQARRDEEDGQEEKRRREAEKGSVAGSGLTGGMEIRGRGQSGWLTGDLCGKTRRFRGYTGREVKGTKETEMKKEDKKESR